MKKPDTDLLVAEARLALEAACLVAALVGTPRRWFRRATLVAGARVFRGDASVNKALRLVLQLMQVVQGPPPRSFAARAGDERGAPKPPARRAYQGSDEARGFKRKPRFGDE